MKQRSPCTKRRRHVASRIGLVMTLLVLGFTCADAPPPKTSTRPLALDCVVDGEQLYLPVEMTVSVDRLIMAELGFYTDATVTVPFPPERFCSLAAEGWVQGDLTSAQATLTIDGIKPHPGAVLTGTNLPITAIDFAAACAAPPIEVELGADPFLAYASGAWTVDYLLTGPPALQFQLSNLYRDQSGPYALSMGLECDPADKSQPPNGTGFDPEDSPRIVADTDDDGMYDELATAQHQVQFNVNGVCAGLPCDDGNDCTRDECDPLFYGACTYSNEAAGVACTEGVGNVCDGAGACVPCSNPCEQDCGQTGGADFDPVSCTGTISLACTNNITPDIAFQRWSLTANPSAAIVSGQPVTVDYGGALVFPEAYLFGWDQPIEVVELIAGAVTAVPRVGLTGPAVTLNAAPVPLTCGSGTNFGLPCATAADCPPGAPFVACGQFIPLPTIDGTGDACAACNAISAEKAAQCALNGYCVAGNLSIPLSPVTETYTADASGVVRIGWDDVNTGATLNPDGTYALPPATWGGPVTPNGVRIIPDVLQVALQCTMAVDAGGPGGTVPPVPGQASPTPDALLHTFNIHVP